MCESVPPQAKSSSRPRPAIPTWQIRLLAAALLLFAGRHAPAQDAPPPSAPAILESVRMNAGAREVRLEGRLREKDQTLEFDLVAGSGMIRYLFKDRPLELALKLGEHTADLVESSNGGPLVPADPTKPLPRVNIQQGELALDFLYWTDAKIERQETIRTRPCWLLRLNAPAPSSRYSVVFVWVDRASGALMRIDGHDWKGQLTRRFEVISARKTSIGWVLKQMRIQQFDPSGATTARIYLEITGETD